MCYLQEYIATGLVVPSSRLKLARFTAKQKFHDGPVEIQYFRIMLVTVSRKSKMAARNSTCLPNNNGQLRIANPTLNGARKAAWAKR